MFINELRGVQLFEYATTPLDATKYFTPMKSTTFTLTHRNTKRVSAGTSTASSRPVLLDSPMCRIRL